MKSLSKNLLPIFTFIAILFVASCREDDFDAPPAGGSDPDLVANTTIADLKSGYVFDQFDTITEEKIIAGVVTADDESGNFYKTIVIQDATAAIAIRIDVSDYNTKYPIGRRIFVKCKGLILGDYNDLIQLGGFIDFSDPVQPSVEPIPYALVDNYFFPGVSGLTVAPTVVTIPDLMADPLSYQNMLIKLNAVEFTAADSSQTYADVPNQLSENRVLRDCDGNTIELRSSNYATFAGQNLPNGNGSLVAISSVYGSDLQLFIRDTYDVNMDTTRCDGNPPPPGSGINEDFSSQTVNTDISLNGWYNIAVVGNRVWRASSFNGNNYASATAYMSSLPAMETWLITPVIDLATIDTLTFISSWQVWKHDGLTVWISTNFNGTNFPAATWTQLTCTLALQADGQFVWVDSGNVPLTSFSGNAHIGFKYVGDGTVNTTTWRIDDVVIH